MNNLFIHGLTGTLLVMLVGCGSNGAGSDQVVDPVASGVEAIFAADRDGDPVTISDFVALSNDIDNRFGGENAQPVELNSGDTIGDVLDRADNG